MEFGEQKVTLIYESTHPKNVRGIQATDHKITFEINNNGVDWNTMLQSYINFLRAIGYVIPEEEDRI